MIDCHTERNAPQPHREPRRVSEEVEVAERSQKGVLHDVVGVGYLNEREGERVNHPLVASDELTERIARWIAFEPSGGNQFGIGLAVGVVLDDSQ
jgi:hypothetical protein